MTADYTHPKPAITRQRAAQDPPSPSSAEPTPDISTATALPPSASITAMLPARDVFRYAMQSALVESERAVPPFGAIGGT
jgi:hypothetical protein